MIQHPTSNCTAVEAIRTQLEWQTDRLHLRYQLHGDLSQLLIPTLVSTEETINPVDGLWEHTCFEAFIAVEDEPDYYEFNFSPSTEWAAYAFSAYRENKPWIIAQQPVINVQQSINELELTAIIPKKALPLTTAKCWQLNLTAVIENKNKEKSYWALSHPTAQADFHHRDGFTYEIWSG
jgi:hypothetical protein